MILLGTLLYRLRKSLIFYSIEQDIESFEPSLESQIEILSLPDGVLTPRQVEILELTFLDELEAKIFRKHEPWLTNPLCILL